uniref:Uncharacterized protein n=1 Tax=Tanacetum cinerariifolium TaxID=118510 RepID=A0A699JZ12_TANCI|nr:hypothetical protein [Tanacetum cinerariifolium]
MSPATATWQLPIGQPPVTWQPRQYGQRRPRSVNDGGHRRSTPPATGQRRRITVVIAGQQWRSTPSTAGQRWRSTTVAGGEPPLTAAGPPLTATGPPVNGGWWACQRAGLDRVWIGSGPGPGRAGSGPPRGRGIHPPPTQYLVHKSLAASHVAASYWTAASDVAASSAPVNVVGQRRSTPPATGQRRQITVVIGGQRR